MHRGPDAVIVLIFFFSGLILNARQIRSGVMDIKGIIAALIIIFLVAPVIGALFGAIPIDTGVVIGIFLVAVMPTTLSSGVVMTGAAGGNGTGVGHHHTGQWTCRFYHTGGAFFIVKSGGRINGCRH